MGAGDGSIAGCDATGGKNGIFQYTARGTCTSTGLDAGATYIADAGSDPELHGQPGRRVHVHRRGRRVRMRLRAASSAAVTRALGADGKPAPAENQGFLRDDAFLYVVVAHRRGRLLGAARLRPVRHREAHNLASPLGPVSSYRCNEFGHLCNGAKPPRLAPTGERDANA